MHSPVDFTRIHLKPLHVPKVWCLVQAQCLLLSTSINADAAAKKVAGQGYLGIANTGHLLPRQSPKTLLTPCTSACLPPAMIHPESGNCCHPTYQKT